MTKDDLIEVLQNHKKWLNSEQGGQRANLRGASLRGADLRDADLRGADLRGAYLRGAYLRGAGLREADLRGAYLRGADLREADLRGAENIPFIPMTPPEKGSFTAFKKCTQADSGWYVIIELLIPADAKRSSATGRKCRASAAEVVEITDIDGTILNDVTGLSMSSSTHAVYRVGETVIPDSWDGDRWNECSHGIHFFLSRQEAVEWGG